MKKKTKPAKADTIPQALSIFLRSTSARLLLATMAVAWVLRFIEGGFGLWDGAVVLGILVLWPIQEWLIHVYILHAKPKRFLGKNVDSELAFEHREHHRRPWALSKVWIPTGSLVMLMLIVLPGYLFAAYNLLPTGLALTFFAVYFTLATLYEWTHFLIHVSYKPRSRFYRRLWKSHRLHHFKNENYWYGVSRLEGDALLGTNPQPRTVETSATCKDLDGGF